MNTHNVEPFVLLRPWLEKLDVAIPEVTEQALVADVAHAVQRKFGVALLQQDWFDSDIVSLIVAAIVVDEPRDLKQIQGGK